ncbi:hypothetical protein N9X43_01490 [Gammaproteobacteria bacterium]|jgi:uncharacterized membrane protein|nr:hypothetical protein [Gammaproteobacteria bacterium]MDA9173924.1 hypothetical protein [Gammaproteobacteria bacterium]MDA9804675.1 hypothetical protein [Gammaproteobacteria bacterium]MDB2503291.1 hypothetical protein [Gammaproteobacteria bacterium]MDC0961928.1 hypothetical protein [Gammaproteobacteria bacterium]|tara:strand:- start:178 stop:678 length:501 start_codon:yes stop_codon:yes gene_type:complete
MTGGITYMGWFHTIVGTPAIVAGLYLMLRDRFIYIDKDLAKFYLIATVITSASSLFIFRATGAFNMAHFTSVIIILAALFAYILHKKSIFGSLNIYLKQLALTGTVFFSMLPTTVEVLKRVPPSNPLASSIEDPIVQNFYMSYVVIFGIFAAYQIFKISKGEMNEI